MSENLCRLCFATKLKRMGILSAQGVARNIAGIIRVHFADEVSETDHLPKSICFDCWTTLKSFHEFYIAVDKAKQIYLTNPIKTGETNFVEIICDAIESDHDVPSIKNEVVEDVPIKVESSELNNAAERRENDSNDNDFDANDISSDDNVSRMDECVDKIGDEFAIDSGRKTREEENAIKANDTTHVLGKSIGDENQPNDQLMSNYMDMNCESCKIPFETLSDAIGHYRNKHNKYSILVRCCQRRLRPSDIRDHIKYHSNPDMFKCNNCGKRFIEKRLLQSHQFTHQPKKFECDICQKKFSFRSGIHSHMLTSHGGNRNRKRYECNVCKKRFNMRTRLKSHVRVVHDRQDKQVCHICAKVYNSLVSLRVHLKDHNGVEEPRADCQICGKSYKNELYVRRHMKTAHPRVAQILQCPKCGKPSPNRNALSKHISTVHNYTVQKCHLCGREFKQGVALREHMATHTGENLYTCAYCPKMFKCKSNMYKHHKQLHPNEWNADRKK